MAHRAKVLRVSGGDGLSQTSDAELENKAPPNFVYLQSHLPQHASATRAHLAGQIATAEGHLEHSFHPPSGYWTPSEKQLFFHGLAVYSRLRPDLIAAHVGTKTAVDVAIYIRLLRDGLKTTAGSLLTSRANMPQAHEASEDLVEFEEEQAALLCGAEPHYEDETRALDREEAAIAFQSSLRAPRGAMKGVERDRAAEKEKFRIFERWKEEHEAQWGREDALRSLDAVQLAVLDRTLRDGEDGQVSLKHTGEKEESQPPVGRPTEAKDAPRPIDDALIDPLLLAESSRAHTPHTAASHTPSRPQTPPPPLPPALPDPSNPSAGDNDDAIPENLSPTSRRRLYKRLYMRRKRAEASGGVVSTETSRLKPGRRSKDKKATSTAASRSAEDLQLELQSVGAGPSHSVEPSDEEDDEDEEDKEGEKKKKKKPNKGGTTRPYKIKRQLEDLDIDYDYLREHRMDLFHLGALGRVMKLYPQLDETAPEGVNTHVSGETIQLLHTLVEDFVRRLMHRTIEAREIEYDLKVHTKAWRLGKERQVLPRNVLVGLGLGGHAGLSKHAHFSSLLGRFPEASDEEAEEEAEDGEENRDAPAPTRPPKGKAKKDLHSDTDTDTDTDTDSDAEADEPPEPILRSDHSLSPTALIPHPHHIYLPFLHHPTVLPATYPFGVVAPGTQAGQSAHERALLAAEPELLSSEDEDGLDEEIKAEERLDEADERAARAAEKAVWRELGVRVKKEEEEEEERLKTTKARTLFAKRGRKRREAGEKGKLKQKEVRGAAMDVETREETRTRTVQAEKQTPKEIGGKPNEKGGGPQKKRKRKKKGEDGSDRETHSEVAMEKTGGGEERDGRRKRRKVDRNPGRLTARDPDGITIKSAAWVVDSDEEY